MQLTSNGCLIVHTLEYRYHPNCCQLTSNHCLQLAVGGASPWWTYPDSKRSRAKSPPPLSFCSEPFGLERRTLGIASVPQGTMQFIALNGERACSARRAEATQQQQQLAEKLNYFSVGIRSLASQIRCIDPLPTRSRDQWRTLAHSAKRSGRVFSSLGQNLSYAPQNSVKRSMTQFRTLGQEITDSI